MYTKKQHYNMIKKSCIPFEILRSTIYLTLKGNSYLPSWLSSKSIICSEGSDFPLIIAIVLFILYSIIYFNVCKNRTPDIWFSYIFNDGSDNKVWRTVNVYQYYKMNFLYVYMYVCMYPDVFWVFFQFTTEGSIINLFNQLVY